MRARLAVLPVLAALAACGQPSGDAPAAGGGSVVQAASTEGAGGGWNALDACSLVTDAKVGSAAGSPVSSHQLTGVMKGEGGLADHSTCLYTLASGATVSMLARRSPSADATPEAIEKARTMGGMAPAAEAVAGLGKAAFWTAQMNTLQVFIDDTRYVTIGVIGPGGGDRKATAEAVARAAM